MKKRHFLTALLVLVLALLAAGCIGPGPLPLPHRPPLGSLPPALSLPTPPSTLA